MNPRIRRVAVQDRYRLKLEFTNGEQGIYDCSHLLGFGLFKEFNDWRYFSQARVAGGTVAWPHGQDICPDTLYLDSEKSEG